MCATDTIVIDISTSLSSDDVRCTVYFVNPLAANPLDSDSRQTNDWAYLCLRDLVDVSRDQSQTWQVKVKQQESPMC